MLKPAELHSPWYACSVFRRQTDKYFKCYLHQVLQLILVDEKYLPVNSVSNNWICSHESDFCSKKHQQHMYLPCSMAQPAYTCWKTNMLTHSLGSLENEKKNKTKTRQELDTQRTTYCYFIPIVTLFKMFY